MEVVVFSVAVAGAVAAVSVDDAAVPAVPAVAAVVAVAVGLTVTVTW